MVVLWQDAVNEIEVVRLTETEEVEELVFLFESIAAEEGWQPEGALRFWLDISVYFALKVKGELVGGLQLVFSDANHTLPCHSVWSEVQIEPVNRCVHVAILTLKENFRGQTLLFWHLVVEMWRYCVGLGIVRLYLEVTPRVYPLYIRLGWPLQREGELRLHWGEDCYLCSLGIPQVAEALLCKAEQSPFYQQIIGQAFRVNMLPNEEKSNLLQKAVA